MKRLCRVVVMVFGVLYVLALAILAIGTFGLFGQEQDPLSAVFLIPLGLPWNQVLDSLPEGSRMLAAVAAPALNLLILWGLCRALGRGREPGARS